MIDQNNPVEYERGVTRPVGTILLLDKTRAKFRNETKLLFYINFYVYDGKKRHEIENDHAISLHTPKDNIKKIADNYELIVNSYENVGDINISVHLDMDLIAPVYQKTKFLAEVFIEESNGSKNSVRNDVEFWLKPNTEESFFVLDYQIASQENANFYNYDVTQESSEPIPVSQPVVHQEGGIKTTLINFRLQNSATYPNAENPTNIIKVTNIALNIEDRLEDFIFLTAQNAKRKRLRLNGLMELQPYENDEVFVSVRLDHNVDAEFFLKKTYSVAIVIDFTQPDIDNNNIEKTVEFPFEFSTLPFLGEEIVAVDFGTSAIASAHYLKGVGDELMSMRKWWEEEHPEARNRSEIDGGAKEQDPHLVSSELYYPTKAKPQERKFRIGMSAGALDEKIGTKSFIPCLKSYIGACQEVYKFSDSSEITIAELVRKAYSDLERHYFLKQRNGEKYRRMVITHPNSYVDGQIAFLKERITENNPEILDIQAMSESDAVIYEYLDNLALYSPDFKPANQGQYENILCYDLGAGTLDISFRRVYFKSKQNADKLIYSPCLDASSELLNMISVNGAGNELDQILAEMIDQRFETIKEENKTQVKNGLLKFPLLFQPDENDLKKQQNLLNAILIQIKAAKKVFAVNKGNENLVVEINKIPVEGSKVIETPDKDTFPDIPDYFLHDQKKVSLIFKPEQIKEKLEQAYLKKHITQPLEVVLHNQHGDKIIPNTVIISGRGALFPGIYEELVKQFSSKVKIISNKTNPEKMKTVVVDGALKWGKDAISESSLFNTPKMHGVIGLAILNNSNDWSWEPLINGLDLNRDFKDREPSTSQMFDPEFIKKIYILQTFIQNKLLVEQYLNRDIDLSGEALDRQIACHDYFRIIHAINNIKRQFRPGKEYCIRINPVTPEDGREYGKVRTGISYLNTRVVIEIEPGGIQVDAEDVGAQQHLEVHHTWPHNLLMDSEGRLKSFTAESSLPRADDKTVKKAGKKRPLPDVGDFTEARPASDAKALPDAFIGDEPQDGVSSNHFLPDAFIDTDSNTDNALPDVTWESDDTIKEKMSTYKEQKKTIG